LQLKDFGMVIDGNTKIVSLRCCKSIEDS